MAQNDGHAEHGASADSLRFAALAAELEDVRHLLEQPGVMDRDNLLAATDALAKRIGALNDQRRQQPAGHPFPSDGAKAEVCEFLRNYGGPKNSFFLQATAVQGGAHSVLLELHSILEAFRDYVASGLHAEISPERRAQLDVVSDLLEQAARFLDDKGVHAAAPAMLIGATLEEFLRTWVESVSLPLAGRPLGIQTYSDLLREADLISKQDAKDLVSWAGIRNHAAHGEWAEVSAKARIQLMLEGVNLFMRRLSSRGDSLQNRPGTWFRQRGGK